MLDLRRLKRMRIRPVPWGQVVVANLALSWDYRLPRRTQIVLEGLGHLPERAGFIAMNHTDRYNYWPFQYALYRQRDRFTATWVKGKYYENAGVAKFMDLTGNIPLPSRGYVITTEFRKQLGRPPKGEEYRALRDFVDRRPGADLATGGDAVTGFVATRGGPDEFLTAFDELFDQMMDEVIRLNREALEAGLHVLVFPQGTRSIRLSRGHTGMMQLAQHLGAHITPVGCSGSDKVYPGGSPFAKGGHIVYRIGEVLPLDGPDLGPHRVRAPFRPFSREATTRHGDAFQAATDVVMDHINGLVDPEYQWSEDQRSGGVQGMNRFV